MFQELHVLGNLVTLESNLEKIDDGRPLIDDIPITTMCSLEQTCNASPLTSVSSVSDDQDDLEALNPKNFFLALNVRQICHEYFVCRTFIQI